MGDPELRFAFRLAHHFQILDPVRMLKKIPAGLLDQWVAFWMLEPFGPLEAFSRSGMQIAQVANLYRKPNTRPISARDIYPVLGPAAPKTSKNIMGKLRGWALAGAAAKPKG